MKNILFFKRMSFLFFALIMFVGVFVESSIYSAFVDYANLKSQFFEPYDVSSQFEVDVSKLPEEAKGKPWVIVTNSKRTYFGLYVLNSPSLQELYCSASGDELPNSHYFGLFNYGQYKNASYYQASSLTSTWENMDSYSYNNNVAICTESLDENGEFQTSWKVGNIYYVASNCNLRIFGIKVFGRTDNHDDDSYVEIIDTYNCDIGYLKNVADKKQVLTNSDGVQDLSSMRKILTFDSTSTTGVDLTTGDYVIRVYGQMAFVKNGTNEIVNEDFPLVHYADFDATDCRVVYNYQELFDLVSESAENPYNVFDTIFGQITRSDNVYFQIYNKTTGEFGGYVKSYLGMTSNMDEESLYTTVDNELNVDDTGYVDYDAPSSGGSGTTWEDAELDDEYIGTSNEDLKDFESTLNIFTSTLGAVPKAIGVVFSFLPPWCLGIIALSFASFGIIAVFKFIRG